MGDIGVVVCLLGLCLPCDTGLLGKANMGFIGADCGKIVLRLRLVRGLRSDAVKSVAKTCSLI